MGGNRAKHAARAADESGGRAGGAPGRLCCGNGLAAAVFTRDIVKGLAIARRINSGICHINGPTVHDEPQMPFGGLGASGHGRFGGRQGIDSFTETRWITIETQPGQYPF